MEANAMPPRKGKSTIRLRQLTPAEEKLKKAIIQASSGCCDHLILPSTGMTSSNIVQSLISEAAENAVLIKKHLERTRNNDKPIRFNTGASSEYLKSLETFPQDTETLVRELVHSVFRNSSGYVVPTSMEDIDNRLEALLEIKSTQPVRDRKELDTIESALKESWNRANNRAKEVFALIDESTYPGPEYVPLLTKAYNGVQDLEDFFDKFHQKLLTLAWEQRTNEYASTSPEPAKDVEEDLFREEEFEFEEDIGFDVPPGNPEYEEGVEGFEGLEREPSQGEQQRQEGDEGAGKLEEKSDNVIRRVSTDVGIIQERVMALSNDIEVLNVQEVTGSPESQDVLRNLQMRCSSFMESLTNDLEALDELSVRKEARLKKKEQVQRIQNLVTTIDNLLPKVHDLADTLRSDVPTEGEPLEGGPFESGSKGKLREEPVQLAGSSLEVEAQSAAQQEILEEKVLNELIEFENLLTQKINEELELQKAYQEELSKQFQRLEPRWKDVALNPNMLVDEDSAKYAITSYLPGMKMSDVTISTTKEGLAPILSIRVFRGPDLKDVALMRRQLVRAGMKPEDDSILRLGMGRFGSSVEKFAVPLDADMAEMQAEYDSGELMVIIPKVRLVHAPLASEILW